MVDNYILCISLFPHTHTTMHLLHQLFFVAHVNMFFSERASNSSIIQFNVVTEDMCYGKTSRLSAKLQDVWQPSLIFADHLIFPRLLIRIYRRSLKIWRTSRGSICHLVENNTIQSSTNSNKDWRNGVQGFGCLNAST